MKPIQQHSDVVSSRICQTAGRWCTHSAPSHPDCFCLGLCLPLFSLIRLWILSSQPVAIVAASHCYERAGEFTKKLVRTKESNYKTWQIDENLFPFRNDFASEFWLLRAEIQDRRADNCAMGEEVSCDSEKSACIPTYSGASSDGCQTEENTFILRSWRNINHNCEKSR